MIVYKFSNSKYGGDLTGTGAAMFGGRWNKKGCPVVYTGESKEIALLELIVHTPPALISNHEILMIDIPEDSVEEIKKENLPRVWHKYPAPMVLSEIAQEWIQREETIALKVPSCIIHSASNYILNCNHPEFYKVRLLGVEAFLLDARLGG
jgi:RES domain-containing protein|tara:strand:- start:38 stop:490 length:453 start_codon:yes stop_codon:yes gene_type:complete